MEPSVEKFERSGYRATVHVELDWSTWEGSWVRQEERVVRWVGKASIVSSDDDTTFETLIRVSIPSIGWKDGYYALEIVPVYTSGDFTYKQTTPMWFAYVPEVKPSMIPDLKSLVEVFCVRTLKSAKRYQRLTPIQREKEYERNLW